MTIQTTCFTRPQASEYLAEKLPFKTEKQWYSFLANTRHDIKKFLTEKTGIRHYIKESLNG